MKARTGKIARLPLGVREELNHRLERSEAGPQLLAWLNALPEVQEIIQRKYDGEPISKQNLSRWRLGGFQDWLTRRAFIDDARLAGDFFSENGETRKGVLADQAATVLAARYAGLLMRWNGECTRDFEAKARVLNDVCRGVAELQREAHQARRDDLDLLRQRGPSPQVTPSHGCKIVGKVGLPADEAVSGLPADGNPWHKPGDSG